MRVRPCVVDVGPWRRDPSPAHSRGRRKGPEAAAALPFAKGWRTLPGLVTHTFTHFHLELTVMTANLSDAQARKLGKDALWTPLERISDAGLPSVMAKIARHAMAAMGK